MPFQTISDFRSKTCCLTGHQDIAPWEERKIQVKLRYPQLFRQVA